MKDDEAKLRVYRPPAKERQRARCDIDDELRDYYYEERERWETDMLMYEKGTQKT